MWSLELINKIFRYDPCSGKLFWKIRPATHTLAGAEAGRLNKNNGYIMVGYKGKQLRAHRVIMKIITGGYDESLQIDHIDHDRTNNRPENLRLVTLQTNNKNLALRKTNNTGTTGVYFCNTRKRYVAGIGVGGKTVHLGRFDTFEEAAAARADAEIKYGFHPNHGL